MMIGKTKKRKCKSGDRALKIKVIFAILNYMPKEKIELNITVNFFKEGTIFIAHSPAFDLSTCGKTFEQAKQRFEAAAGIFIDETKKRGTLENVLLGLGWQKKKANLQPPIFVGQGTHSFAL